MVDLYHINPLLSINWDVSLLIIEIVALLFCCLTQHLLLKSMGNKPCNGISQVFKIELDFDITSLNGLSTVSFIGRDHKIQYDFSMHSLKVLAGMTYVEGNLHLVSNPVLNTLATIEKMTSSGGCIDVS